MNQYMGPENFGPGVTFDLSKAIDDYLKTLGWLPYVEVSIEIGVDEIADGEDTVVTETEVTSTIKKRAMTEDEKTDHNNSMALQEIFYREQLETPQRIAEALPDESGGSADGRAWFKANRAKIAAEQAKLV